mgnify:CR=1 FL=1
MSNQYGIVVPSGSEYPSQEFVDNFLNGIDAIPTCTDLQRLKDMGEEAAKAYIAEKVKEAQEKIKAYFDGITSSAESKMKPLEPLIKPPAALDDVINYCTAVAEYFAKPYNQIVEMLKFYGEFSAAATQALAKKSSDLGCIAVIPPVPTIPTGE